MAGSKTDFAENTKVNHILRAVALPTLPASLYFGLFTAAPGETGGGTELTIGTAGYARSVVSRATGSWSAPSTVSTTREISNAVAIAFPTATGNWGSIVGVGVFDAASAGNMWYWMDLTTPRTINSGEVTPTLGIGSVLFAEGGNQSSWLADAWLNWVFRGTAFPTLGASVHAALFSATPSLTAGGTEFVIGTGAYARVGVTRNTSNWTAASNGASDNVNAITFPSPTADWGSYVAAALMDAATAGNMLWWSPVGTSRSVLNGDLAPSFAAGAYDIVDQ